MSEKITEQTSFRNEYRFASKCSHCGKPMAYMSIDRYESVGPGQLEERPVYIMWIDPFHECTFLDITAKKEPEVVGE